MMREKRWWRSFLVITVMQLMQMGKATWKVFSFAYRTRKHSSSSEHGLWDHNPHHCPGWRWQSNLEKKVSRAKRSSLPSHTSQWVQFSLRGARISALRPQHVCCRKPRPCSWHNGGFRELSVRDNKTGATNFSLFFGSWRAVNFQALWGLTPLLPSTLNTLGLTIQSFPTSCSSMMIYK